MSKEAASKRGNSLLARLPESTCTRLRPDLKLVPLVRGMDLYRQDANARHVYFPRSGLVSLLPLQASGDAGEIALVGNEGIVGVSLLADSESMPTRAVVQTAGEAWAMPAARASAEFRQDADFQILVLRYTQALMAQMAQATLCTRRHKVEQQACRWLLFAFDRAGEDELKVTHEGIADALGVRREGITEALGRLQQQSGIHCSRGRIRLMNRPALEACSCKCYGAVRDEYQRLLETSRGMPATTRSWCASGGMPNNVLPGIAFQFSADKSLTEKKLAAAKGVGSAATTGVGIGQPAPCVLIAEDEMFPAIQLEDQLKKAGYRVLKAARLPAALELAESAQIDAAILDINLNGADVFPAAARLRQRGIPFLFASAYDRTRLPQDFCESLMLRKPYGQDLLWKELGRLLEGNERGNQSPRRPFNP